MTTAGRLLVMGVVGQFIGWPIAYLYWRTARRRGEPFMTDNVYGTVPGAFVLLGALGLVCLLIGAIVSIR